jgi:hypothetical protein
MGKISGHSKSEAANQWQSPQASRFQRGCVSGACAIDDMSLAQPPAPPSKFELEAILLERR